MFLFITAIFVVFILRTIVVFSRLGKRTNTKSKNVRVLAIAGSGGHTSELLRLLKALSHQYVPRYYVVADTDKMSASKIHHIEKDGGCTENKEYYITYIPRSREVAQPWLSSFWTTLIATISSFKIIWRSRPDLILCNGPGTCIPICIVGFLFKFLGIGNSQIIFVESICRVESLSLSGLLLYYFADKTIVQWPELQKKYPKSLYFGRIV